MASMMKKEKQAPANLKRICSLLAPRIFFCSTHRLSNIPKYRGKLYAVLQHFYEGKVGTMEKPSPGGSDDENILNDRSLFYFCPLSRGIGQDLYSTVSKPKYS
jgi:hypothetical protein